VPGAEPKPEKEIKEEDRDDFYGKKFLKHLDDKYVET
jgi:hypothetical protein